MAKEVKRGDIRVASTHTQNEDDDEEMVNLTTICIVGNALRDDQDLIKDPSLYSITKSKRTLPCQSLFFTFLF